MEQSEVVYNTADICDAISKASRVAPSKGHAFDAAAGIIIDAQMPGDTPVTKVYSTNLDTTYTQWLYPVSQSGPPLTWRVPSDILDSLIQTFPKGEGSTVTFIGRGDDKLRVMANNSLTALNLLDVYSYPMVQPEPQFHGIEANEVASKLEQVSWACDPKDTKLRGVMFDGTHLVGCSGYAMALVPCKVGVTEQVVAPLDTLKTILKGASDVYMEQLDGKLHIRLDEMSSCSTTLIAEQYPNISLLRRDEFLGSFTFHKAMFMECMTRMNIVARKERLSFVDLRLERTMFTKLILDCEIKGVARSRDELDVETDFDGEIELSMQPSYIEKAIENCKGDIVRIDFGVPNDPKKVTSVRVTDESGYECWVLPRRKPA